MTFTETQLAGSYEVHAQPFSDDRGWFARTYCKKEFESIGHKGEWVQMNHSYTRKKASIRGMHFQIAPFREIKLVRCVRGSVYDVIIDLRKSSDTFLQWHAVELSAIKMNMLYIPQGFAHGFQTLEDDCELVYCHSEFYTAGSEGGINFSDPQINIIWPLSATVISERDLAHALITDKFEGL